MDGFGLYNYSRRLELAIENLNKDPGVSKENKESIISFSKVRLAKGASHGRVAKVVYCLRFLAAWLNKPFGNATKENLIALVGGLETNPKYSEYTRLDYKIVLKMYYKWLKGNDETFPPEISWLKPKLKNGKHKLPEDLLTEDEILRIVNEAENPRDKAFVLVLYESGCRIGELLTLSMQNVKFDQYGAVLRVSGKTGDRRVRVISSAPALALWVDNYRRKDDPKAPLWPPRSPKWKTKNMIECMDHRSVYKLLRNLAIKAGIKKHIHPHLFRHSRATALASKLTEAQMKEHFGWVQGSDMASTYVHMSGRDVDNALLKIQGLVHDEVSQEEKIKAKNCQRCKEHNSPASKYCTRCGLPLDETLIVSLEKDRQATDSIMNRLMQDNEFKDMMLKKIFEMGLEKAIV
ncbi:site-specific integrase [Candidatus Micrarchaeota archaeon]|nr:site-specific integrase [Candidatus Micrarchaeota archaeon]